MNALYKGFIVSAVASLVILWPVTDYVIVLQMNIWLMEIHSMEWIYIIVGLLV